MKRMNIIFIAGTDTGVGKSVVTGLLARHLLEKGRTVVTQKWVQTGYRAGEDDIDTHLRFMGKAREEYKAYMPLAAPYVFRFASSPHLASRLEGRAIDINRIAKNLETLSGCFDFVIVEGTGGLMVPFDGKTLAIDLIKKLGIPVILVAANKLGAINHAILSAEAIRSRKIKCLGVIFNNLSKTHKSVLKDNPRAIRGFAHLAVLGQLPRTKNARALQKLFMPVGERILANR